MLYLYKRRAVVLLLIVTLSASLFLAPAIVMRTSEASPFSTSPTMVDQAVDMVDSINERLSDPMAREQKVDSLFASYIETDATTTEMDTSHGGVDFLLVLFPGSDVNAVKENAQVHWAVDMGFATYVYGTVFTSGDARILTKLDGLMYISADKTIPKIDMRTDVPEPDMFEIADDLGSSGAAGLGYTGDGVTVAVTDFCADFSVPDLVDAADVDSMGRPTSYDPSGAGTQFLTYANATNVANTTEWLAAGYALTYYNATSGKYYLNVTDWDPITARAPFSASAHWLRRLLSEHFGAYGYGLDTWFIEPYLWRDWELPAPGSFDNYTVGWVYEMRDDHFDAFYAPALVLDASKLVIDWAGMATFSKLINDVYWHETVADPNVTEYIDLMQGMMDWSFKDDYDGGWIYTVDGTEKGPVVHYNDGTNYYGLGSLGWMYDHPDFYTHYFNETYFAGTGMNATDEELFCGFRADGLGFGLIYAEYSGTPSTNHGQWIAGSIASRGVFGHKVYEGNDPMNDTEYFLPGVAPGASLMSIKNFGSASIFDDFGGTFWACGFHLNSTSGMWEYTGEHKADILTMSWGWGAGSQFDLFWTTLAFDAMSIPGYADPAYEGILMFSSSGNSGPGYMSSGAPATGGLVVCVGATTKNHYWNNFYSEGQINANSPAAFSSMGPNFLGYPKPDVVAPGYRGVNPQPIQNIMYEGLPYLYVSGAPAVTYKWWQGTSLSSPLAAAVAAVALEAMMDNGWAYDPYVLKEVVLSSSEDLGMDPFIQGHGQVNAYEACLAIDGMMNDRYYFQTGDTMDNYYESAYISWRWWIWAYAGYYHAPWPAAAGGDNWLDIPNDVWEGMPYPPGHPSAPYPLNETPALTSSIFFGDVLPGETKTVTVNATGYDGVDYEASGNYGVTAWEYVMGDELSFEGTTYTYDDSGFDPAVERPGFFDLNQEFLDAGYLQAEIDAAFADPYAFVVVNFDADYIGEFSICRLFDWADDGPGNLAGNGELNYYNMVYTPWGEGFSASDTLRNIGRAYNEFNSMIIRIGDVNGISNIFQNTPTLQVEDSAPHGRDFKVSLITWEVQTGSLGVDSHTGGFNVTVTPTSDEYGVHAGFVEVDSGTWTHQIPFSYMVAVDLDVPEGEVVTMVDGAGTDFNPYDNGAVFAAADLYEENFAGAGDKRTFRIEVPEPADAGLPANAGNGSVLAFKVSWENPGTVVDMFLIESYESDYVLAQTNLYDYPLNEPPVRPTYNTMVFDGGPESVYLYRGEWYLQLVVSAWNGTDPYEAITLEVQWFMQGPSSSLESTYSVGGGAATAFGSSETLAGHHVELNFTYTDYTFPLNPDFEIVETELAFLSGLFFEEYDIPLVIPTLGANTPFNFPDTPLPADQVSIAVIKGLAPGDPVDIVCDFSIGDCDFWVVDGETPASYGNDLVTAAGGTMASGAHPEVGSFTWTSTNDTMIIVCWNYDQDPGTWSYTVDTRSAEAQPAVPGRTVIYDTYDFYFNITKDIQVTAYTATEVAWVETLNAVTFGNFFIPTIELLAPMGGEDWSIGTHNITFTSDDANGDDLIYQIRFSKDGGTYWQTLFTGPVPYDAVNSYYYYSWTTTAILATDEALIEVTAFDNDTAYAGQFGLPTLWPGDPSIPDASDDVFTLGSGTIPTPTTTTTTTVPTTPTTTTEPPPPPPPIDPLLLGLIAGIGVGVVVILILFLVKKK